MSNSIRKTLEGKRILLTGTTGFLGKVWLEMVLRLTPEIGHVYLLVRANRDQNATQRLETMFDTSPVFRELRAKHGQHLSEWLQKRVTVVDGDVSYPNFGLSDSEAADLANDVDLVMNFADITDFQPDPKLAEQVNVQGALHAADFAARTQTKQLLHVSTCYVAGNQSGPIAEELNAHQTPTGAPLDPRAEHEHLRQMIQDNSRRTANRIDVVSAHARKRGWPNIYTYSKALAEHLLQERNDIGLTLARPSIVECSLQAPFEGWNEGINTSAPLSWLIASYFRDLPARPNNRFDIIPVDTVARGIFLICQAIFSGQARPVYHLASSDINPLTFGRTIELNGLAVRRYLRKNGGTNTEKFVLQHLDPVGVPLDAQRLWNVPNLRELAQSAKGELATFDSQAWLPNALRAAFAKPLQTRVDAWREQMSGATRQLRRVEKMLELYQPFIHDNDYEFCTANIRALAQTLVPEEQECLGWNAEEIDWRLYWIDVQYPGLKKWSIPLLHGESVPSDAPSANPVRLQQFHEHSPTPPLRHAMDKEARA